MKINNFRDEYFYLSNFYSTSVLYKGIVYQNNEAAFQAQKCVDVATQTDFAYLTPSQAKAKGRKVQLRANWDKIKENHMYNIVMAKFIQNHELLKKLLATGDSILEEGNTLSQNINFA